MWLTWHFPAPPSCTAGRAGPNATCSSVCLLGLASASGLAHLTFYKTAWDSRTGPMILAEASFLVVNGLALQLCIAAKAWQGSGLRSKTESAAEGWHLPPLHLGEDSWRPVQGPLALAGFLFPGGRSQQDSHLNIPEAGHFAVSLPPYPRILECPAYQMGPFSGSKLYL